MTRLFTALLLLVLTVPAAVAQQHIFRYEVGKDYTYVLEETNMSIQEVQGQSMTQNSESTVSATIKLSGIADNGDMSMNVKINNALVIVEANNQTQTLGSDFGGKALNLVVDQKGNVVDVDTTNADEAGQAGSLIVQIGEMLPNLTKGTLEVGQSWNSHDVDTSGSGDNLMLVETERKYTVKGKKEMKGFDCLEIGVTVDAEIEGTRVNGDNELQIKGTREGKGTLYYAPAEGLFVAMNMEVTTDQVITVMGMNMRVPVTGSSTVTFELQNK